MADSRHSALLQTRQGAARLVRQWRPAGYDVGLLFLRFQTGSSGCVRHVHESQLPASEEDRLNGIGNGLEPDDTMSCKLRLRSSAMVRSQNWASSVWVSHRPCLLRLADHEMSMVRYAALTRMAFLCTFTWIRSMSAIV